MTANDSEHPVLSVLNGTVRILVGTLLVGLLASRIAAYYADVRTASELKDELGAQVMRSTTTETESLTVLVKNLSPQSYLGFRCATGGIPDALSAQARTTACDDAIVQEILEEQQLNNDVRAAHGDGALLQKRLEGRLTGAVDADYAELLNSLEILRKLNSSTTCNAGREEVVATLQARYAWVDPQTAANLVGPATGDSCDDHGEDFPAAAGFLASGLAFESEVVASHIEGESVKGLNDTQGDLVHDLVTDEIVLILLGLGLALFVMTSILKRRLESSPPK